METSLSSLLFTWQNIEWFPFPCFTNVNCSALTEKLTQIQHCKPVQALEGHYWISVYKMFSHRKPTDLSKWWWDMVKLWNILLWFCMQNSVLPEVSVYLRKMCLTKLMNSYNLLITNAEIIMWSISCRKLSLTPFIWQCLVMHEDTSLPIYWAAVRLVSKITPGSFTLETGEICLRKREWIPKGAFKVTDGCQLGGTWLFWVDQKADFCSTTLSLVCCLLQYCA